MNIIIPIDIEQINNQKIILLQQLMEISPLFECPQEAKISLDLSLKSFKHTLYRIIPEDILEASKSIISINDEINKKTFYQKITEGVPFFTWSNQSSNQQHAISIATLCPVQNMHGVGRFLCDTYSRWLIPGKQLPLVYVHSITFKFVNFHKCNFLLHEVFIQTESQKEQSLVYNHLPSLVNEIKLNILSVQHARKIISIKSLTTQQKKIIIQENITSLLDRPLKNLDNSIFDQIHNFFIKIYSEEKILKIREDISPLLELKPQIFERDIFLEIQNFLFLFKDNFNFNRELKHLVRIIAYKYLFKKLLIHAVLDDPNKRHVNIKISNAKIKIEEQTKNVLSVLIGVNLLRENEVIGEKNIENAIKNIIQNAKKVPNSTIIDIRNNSNVSIIYLEMYKTNGDFSKDDIKSLRKRLPREINIGIESVVNPIFMSRNEEEVLRNILVLSKQLKYVKDIPQVIITFHKQVDTLISFTVILLRVSKRENTHLKNLFHKCKKIKFSDHEVKFAGLLRNKHPKEANVFELHISKKDFLRRDFSVDLNKARLFIYNTLTELFGEVRDYNGGMISKQSEAFNELKKLLLQLNISNDFLLENFFYSLTPKYMQSILQSFILKKLFLIILEAIEYNYNVHRYFLKTQIIEDNFLMTISSTNPTLKELIEGSIEELEIPQSSLITSYINIYDVSCLSFILKFTNSDQHQKFLQKIIENIKTWKKKIETIPFFSQKKDYV